MRSRNRYSRRAKARRGAIQELQEEFGGLPQPGVRRVDRRLEIDAPSNFSLKDNYDQVVGFLWRFREEVAKIRHLKELRQIRNAPLRINLKTIKSLAPGAGLVLAAEIDRWRRDFGFRPLPAELEEWDPSVRARLIELGFFDLLDVPENLRPSEQAIAGRNKMIRFLSDVGAPGSACQKLKDELEIVAGRVPARTYFHDGVSEAMANVGHHAYPARLANAAVPWMTGRWWATGWYRPADGALRVIFYDQGVGIPATLPVKVVRNERQKSLFQWIASELERIKTNPLNHGALLQAALMYPRSSTGQANRGNVT